MLRKIIHIDEELCTGCRACVDACHEGAIELVEGKARLVRDDYCDGLGDCLPACPTGAITFTVREAAAYDAAAVEERMRRVGGISGKQASEPPAQVGASANAPAAGCPGSRARSFEPASGCCATPSQVESPTDGDCAANVPHIPSELRQWPIQIKLVPERASYFEDTDVLVAADCTAFSYGAFHPELLRGKVLLVGCPKLDDGDWADKLARIVAGNAIRSLTVVRMEVPCCGGLERAVMRAAEQAGRDVPVSVTTVSVRGELL